MFFSLIDFVKVVCNANNFKLNSLPSGKGPLCYVLPNILPKFSLNRTYWRLSRLLQCQNLYAIFSGNWNVCLCLVLLTTVPQMVSAYNLVLITATRFIAVKWPFRVNSILTRTKCIVSVVFAWTLATVISVCTYFQSEPGKKHIIIIK